MFENSTGGLASASKEIEGVFTSIKSISLLSQTTNDKGPFNFYTVEMGWSLDAQTAETGDYFLLTMPYVFEVRITDEETLVDYFDILFNGGQTLASCDVDQAAGKSLETMIQCEITANLEDLDTLTGTVSFVVVFDGGCRTATIEAGSHWVSGTNTVYFNGNLQGKVDLGKIETGRMDLTETAQSVARAISGGESLMYYSPQLFCSNAGGVSSGTITLTLTGAPFVDGTSELYYSDEMSPYLYPVYASEIPSTQLTSSSSKTLEYAFGAISNKARLWWSTFIDSSVSAEFNIEVDVKVTCSKKRQYNFETESARLKETYTLVHGTAGGSGSGGRKQDNCHSYFNLY
ncbi:uncharacterized protein CYBJADRAFT_184333 [Cyberlindnera jadinii NRRL Y-1542]|uniref:Agglutinin-like protein N-terminal domain-containing protein n=1 Tax=Cyberlindnera jadinii (strain ATCC 18201 / CBS 1600 / BCRC 20928 / JCM 3617 / NBRC 0987 / NRRL Y-1542) TaxID=983966 RepID=A0A1E4S382_CYBJN|nr:hypothetical protein CYBJADRAFT_184333 [Cyberlindnera jadinii NRRL Y-1542]ODV73910.1 hypothetical protein CYBJADRAFT_184333 [Cyberlindnera jadinii NRRL Y-1542]